MSRDVLVATLVALWTMLFTRTVEATTLNQFMGGYEHDLLQWAATTALLGGGLRTIFSLQADRRIVREITAEAGWDALKALAAGMLAFLVIQAMRSSGWAIPSEVRFAAVLVAGWSRLATFEWFGQWLKARKQQFIDTPFKKDES